MSVHFYSDNYTNSGIQLELLNVPEESEFDRAAKYFEAETHLTYDMTHPFVQAVYVFPDRRTEIEWKFKDIAYSIGIQ